MNLVQPIIDRKNTYVLTSSKLSVHSIDRDIQKWKNSNHFSIDLPASIHKVTSLTLTTSIFPSNQNVISNINENTKLFYMVGTSATIFEIELPEGTYNSTQLANELKYRLNKQVDTEYSGFNVLYNEISHKFLFTNHKDSFTFKFSIPGEYDTCSNMPPLYLNYSGWGLGYNLGFNTKTDYVSTSYADGEDKNIIFGYKSEVPVVYQDDGNHIQVVYADVNPRILGDTSIYMEVKHYNQYDEIIPYSETNNTTITASNRSSIYTRNDGVGGTINSAFAKIPIIHEPLTVRSEPFTNNISNISTFDEPINRLSRLEFKFRYHNGRMVNFQDYPFEFTLDIKHLIDEIPTNYRIRS